MAVSIAFANQKGGVGKSTLAVQFAYYLQLKKGKKVLFVDMDAQGNSSKTLLQIEGDQSIEEVLTSTRSEDLFKEDEDAPVKVQTTPRGIDLIGSDQSSDGYWVEKLPDEAALLPRTRLQDLVWEYDCVIIDCPPSLGNRLAGSLLLADWVVCPVKLSGYSVDGMSSLYSSISAIQEGPNPNLSVLGIAVNEFQDTGPQRRALREIDAALPDMLFETKVRSRAPIDDASYGTPIFEVRNGARAAEELSALFEEMLNRIGSGV